MRSSVSNVTLFCLTFSFFNRCLHGFLICVRFLTAPAKKWIQQNREDLLDEIDSEFIKSTIYQLEDVPGEVKTSWSDPNKSRTEKAKKFLDFALQKDEYVKALKKTIEEYGMQLPE